MWRGQRRNSGARETLGCSYGRHLSKERRLLLRHSMASAGARFEIRALLHDTDIHTQFTKIALSVCVCVCVYDGRNNNTLSPAARGIFLERCMCTHKRSTSAGNTYVYYGNGDYNCICVSIILATTLNQSLTVR